MAAIYRGNRFFGAILPFWYYFSIIPIETHSFSKLKIMANNSRDREGGSKEQVSHNHQQNGRNRNQAPEGFEGMNYEQQRGPYRGGITNSNNSRNNNEGPVGSGSRREEP